MATLLALHGQTLNGTLMRQQLAWLEARGVELICPDGPVACSDSLVERLYAVWDQPRQPGPYRAWWTASEDAKIYDGWEQTREMLVPILERGPIGVLGFSQGAIAASALAALSQVGGVPPISYVILIAGRTPRADVITPHFAEPVRVPSLHIWGEADTLMGTAPADQVERYDAATRKVVTWPGTHVVPTEGPAAEAIERLILA